MQSRPCSPQGGSLVRVQLLDPEGHPPTVAANAVIVPLHCGAVMRPDGIADIPAVPAGDHMIQVRAIGFPPDSVPITIGTADTVRVTAHLQHGYPMVN